MDGTPHQVQAARMTEDEAAQEAAAKDAARARFRAALERKTGKHVDTAGHNPNARHPHTAPAKPQKTFRRKSG